ncbi:hypothetical protein GIB67_025909, partial [Kingdonia uniflora]
RLKLKYSGDRSLEMAIPAPIPLTYQGLSEDEAVEAEEDFYYNLENDVNHNKYDKQGQRNKKYENAEASCFVLYAKGNRTLTLYKVENVPLEFAFKMGNSSANEVSTSGRANESDNEEEIGLEQFPSFPGQLVSYPPGFDAFRGLCKAKADVEGKWVNCVEFAVAEEETELELVLEGLGLSRKRRVDCKSNKVRKAQSARSMAGVDEGKKQTLPASGATESGKVTKEKRKRIESSGEKVTEVRPTAVDDLKGSRKGPDWRLFMEKKIRTRCQLQVEENANLDEMVEEHDKLGRHLMLKGYSEEETVLDNQEDDVILPEGGSEKVVREMSLRINDLESGLSRERKTSKALLSAQAELQVKLNSSRSREDNVLMYNQEFVEQFDRMKEENENREDQYVKGKVLEGEIKEIESLVKRKEELLKDLLAREELNAKIGRLCTRVVDLEAMNLAEFAKYVAKLEEDVIYHDKVDMEIIEWKNDYARLKSRLERLKDDKRLESEWDTLFKTLSDKGCICGAKIDRGNCLGSMESQLGPQTAESIEQGRAVVAHKLKERPLDVGGSTAEI